MSSNADLVRRLLAAFNERDVEAFLAGLDPDVELYPLRAQLEGRQYRGHDGAREMLADFDEDWEGLRIEIDELREAGEEVVAVARMQGRGRTSGVELDVPMGFLWRFREGRVMSGRTFSEPAEALRAAGLEPSS